MSSNKVVPMESVASVAISAERENGSGGLGFPRHFTRHDSNPFEEIEWEIRAASVSPVAAPAKPQHQRIRIG
jgi:hypothetical protein